MIAKIINRFKLIILSNESYARSIGVSIGENCKIKTSDFGSEPYLIEIGNHVQITQGVKFFNHGAAWIFREAIPDFDVFGKIKIGNNVYIGNNSLIMPGVTIGDNVIIGAGAVVTKSFVENKIIAGNPAKVIGEIEDLKKRIVTFNLNSKGMDYREKKDFLLAQPDSKFLTK
jgi:acetyltransferase-like isoleucine patch superfamily enzyme|tara:strand:- start:402 stop:917 length:516 start_codon:yes stop_codon:yes gene_type:complete